MPWFLFRWVKVKAPAEDLHAQESKDDDKEEEQQQQRRDGLDGVEKGSDQVGERPPVPEGEEERRKGGSQLPGLR